MMRICFFLGFLFLSLSCLKAQMLLVCDADERPVVGVQVASLEGKSRFVTDEQGRVNGELPMADFPFVLSKEGFENFLLRYEDLGLLRDTVRLRPLSVNLPSLQISDKRDYSQSSALLNPIETISLEEIQVFQPGNSADLLGMNGSVFVQRSQQGGGSPMIRGFAANRILIHVDGVRMNHALFRGGNNHQIISVDPSMLEQAAVIFGPGAQLYGTDAIGGVLQMNTRAANFSKDGGHYLKVGANLQLSSANWGRQGSFRLAYEGPEVSVLSTFYSDSFGDLRMGSRGDSSLFRSVFVQVLPARDSIVDNPSPQRQRFSNYQQWGMMQKLKWQIHKHWSLQYAFHYSSTGDVPRYDRLLERDTNGVFRHAEWFYGPQIWQMHHLKIQSFQATAWYDVFTISLAQQYFQESRNNRLLNRDMLIQRREDLNAWNVNMDAQKLISTRWTLWYGLQGILNTLESKANQTHRITQVREEIPTRFPDGSIWYAADAYANVRYQHSSAWTWQAGVRLTHASTSGQFDTVLFPFPFDDFQLSQANWTGSIGGTYQMNDKWSMHAHIATAFRLPSLDDMAKIFDPEPGSIMVPNPALRAEQALHQEIFVRYRKGEKLSSRAGFYYTRLYDAMVRRPFLFNGQDSIELDGERGQAIAFVNASEAFVWGFEGEIRWQFAKQWTLDCNYRFQRGFETTEDGQQEPLRHAAPAFGRVGLQYKLGNFQVHAFTFFQQTLAVDRMPPSERAKTHLYILDENNLPFSPAWLVFNLRSSYQIREQFRMTFGIENLMDRAYRPYSSGISPAGINFLFGLHVGL